SRCSSPARPTRRRATASFSPSSTASPTSAPTSSSSTATTSAARPSPRSSCRSRCRWRSTGAGWQARRPHMPDTAEAKRRLEAQLAELEDRLSRIERDLGEEPDADSSERAVQMEDDEALEGQAAVISNEIASVRRALDRIENGTYGEGVKCGEPIAEGRLEARPEAALCIECASAG